MLKTAEIHKDKKGVAEEEEGKADLAEDGEEEKRMRRRRAGRR